MLRAGDVKRGSVKPCGLTGKLAHIGGLSGKGGWLMVNCFKSLEKVQRMKDAGESQ